MSKHTFLTVLLILPLAVRSQGDDINQVCPYSLISTEASSLAAHDGDCYIVLDTQLDYDYSKYQCKRYSAYRVMPRSQSANDFLVELMKQRGLSQIWMGADDRKYDKIFQWDDGSYIFKRDFSNFASGNGFNRGTIGGLLGLEHCVGINAGDGKWHDYRCSSKKNTICQVLPY